MMKAEFHKIFKRFEELEEAGETASVGQVHHQAAASVFTIFTLHFNYCSTPATSFWSAPPVTPAYLTLKSF